MEDFPRWCFAYQALTTFLSPFLTPLDRWVLRQTCRMMRSLLPLTDKKKPLTCILAANRNHWVALKQTHLSFGCSQDCIVWKLCYIAAKNNNVEMMEWALNNQCMIALPVKICKTAAHHGSLDVLKWLTEVDGSSQFFRLKSGISYFELLSQIARNAARFGQLDVLKWAKDQGCERQDDLICSAAARGGHKEVLQWAHDNGFSWSWKAQRSAASAGNFELVKWLRENGCPWGVGTTWGAALSGNLEMLQWLINNGCPSGDGILKAAARGGHIHIIDWAIENGYLRYTSCAEMYEEAAEEGHLDVIKWLHSRNHRSNQEVFCASAVRNGHLDVLQWAEGNGYRIQPWGHTMFRIAGRKGHFDIVKWGHEKGYNWTSSLILESRYNGYHHIADWALERGCPLPTSEEKEEFTKRSSIYFIQ